MAADRGRRFMMAAMSSKPFATGLCISSRPGITKYDPGERSEVALKDARAGKAKADRTAKRERGKAELWRQLYSTALAPTSPKSAPVDLPQIDD